MMRRYLALLGAVIFWAMAGAADKPRPWPSDEPPFQPVNAERVAKLPVGEQAAWRAYLAASDAFAAKLPPRKAPEFTPLIPINGPPIPGKHSRGLRLNSAKEWFAGAEAQTIADRVVERQSLAGAWPKGNDYTQPTPVEKSAADVWSGGTFDNDATTWELRFLALANAAASEPARGVAWRESFLRGLRYIFAAQYPNGGIPQIYPLVGGYHDAITYNDDAMTQAVELMRDIGDGKPEFAFVPADLRAQCGPRVARAITLILATQLRDAKGTRTVWCQQHDALTLKPCAARNFEPFASCTNESASVVRFLMTLPQPSADVRASIEGAVAWFNRVALHDLAWTRAGGVGKLVARPGAPLLWSRMYEMGTDKAVFGDRDRTIHYDVDELSTERRGGYAWYGTWPSAALTEYAAWKAKQSK